MLVSIITIVYNAKKTLEQTILSVINQTYPNIEYIIIDGGSTDGSVDIIKKYEHQINFWISEKDRGISDAFNKGIAKATGELVGIINADDWYETDAVQTIVNSYSSRIHVYCGMVSMISEKGVVQKVRMSDDKKLNYGMYIMHPTTFVKRVLYERIGNFDVEYRYAMDYDLILRVRSSGYSILCIPTKIACMRVGGISSDMEVANLEVIRIMKKHFSTFEYILGLIYTKLNSTRVKILNLSLK
jgi:glycosyltransferase involved in cell wall biosynthesis